MTRVLRTAGAVAVAAAACGGDRLSGPADPRVQPGLYVLESLGGQPAPYVFERAVYGDTAVVTLGLAFDSVRVLNDTTFERHFRRELVVSRPGIPPIVEGVEQVRFGGLILDRGDEIKLVVRSGNLPGGHELAYFTPVDRGTGLNRLVTSRQYDCQGSRCVVSREVRIRAVYARR